MRAANFFSQRGLAWQTNQMGLAGSMSKGLKYGADWWAEVSALERVEFAERFHVAGKAFAANHGSAGAGGH